MSESPSPALHGLYDDPAANRSSSTGYNGPFVLDSDTVFNGMVSGVDPRDANGLLQVVLAVVDDDIDICGPMVRDA